MNEAPLFLLELCILIAMMNVVITEFDARNNTQIFNYTPAYIFVA